MIALTAYGIRKAYKKQQARKAHKEQLERENQSLTAIDPSDELRSTSSFSCEHSPDLRARPVSGGLVSYGPSSPSSLARVPSTSPSGYSASLYSEKSYKDPLEEMRQYRAYIQRQSHDFGNEINPPTYEFVVEQGIEPTYPLRSGLNLPRRTETISEIQEARHIPQGLNRVVELDSSSESSPSTTEGVRLRLSHPRSPITHEDGLTYPATELPADLPKLVVSSILDDELQSSLDDLFAEVPPPLRIRKSKEIETYELPAHEITAVGHEEEHEEDTATEPERQQLKRPRVESESGSEIESEDNEEVIVRFNVADRTKRPYPKRVTVANYE